MRSPENTPSSFLSDFPIYQPDRLELLRAEINFQKRKIHGALSNIERHHSSVRDIRRRLLGKKELRSPELQFPDECLRTVRETLFIERQPVNKIPNTLEIETSRGKFSAVRSLEGSQVASLVHRDTSLPGEEKTGLRILLPRERIGNDALILLSLPKINVKDPKNLAPFLEIIRDNPHIWSQYDQDTLTQRESLYRDSSDLFSFAISFFTDIEKNGISHTEISAIKRKILETFESLPSNWSVPTKPRYSLTQLVNGNIFQNQVDWGTSSSYPIYPHGQDVFKIKPDHVDVSPSLTLGLFDMHEKNAAPDILADYYWEALKYAKIVILTPGQNDRESKRLKKTVNPVLIPQTNT